MAEVQALLGYTGTGLSRPLRKIAERYYGGIMGLRKDSDLITLPRAGMFDPRLRHRHSTRVSDRKQRGREVKYHIWGHSQGGIEVIFQMLRSQLPIGKRFGVVFCLGAPLAGSSAELVTRVLRVIPWPMCLLFEGLIQMSPDSRSQKHLHEKLAATIEQPGFYLPHIYLLAAAQDHLVSQESAWHWPPSYPADKVHRVLVVHGEIEVPEGVIVIQVDWGMDLHVTMVRAPEVWAFMDEMMAAHDSEHELAAVIG